MLKTNYQKFYIYILFFLTFAFLFISISCDYSADLYNQTKSKLFGSNDIDCYHRYSVTAIQEFQKNQKDFVDTATSVTTYKAAEAYKKIRSNIDTFNSLYQLVNSAKHIDDIIDELADGLLEIAISYEQISQQRENIFSYRRKGINDLSGIKDNSIDRDRAIRTEITRIQRQNEQLRLSIQRNTEGSHQRTQDEITLRANEVVMKSLESQLIVWNKFTIHQERLIVEIENSNQPLELLMHIMEQNARVYREAYNAVKLRKEARIALQNLAALAEMGSLLGELQDTWEKLDKIIQDVSDFDFNVSLL